MRTISSALALAAAFGLGASHAASAQVAAAVVHAAGVSASIPNITRATNAARHAAAAANAHAERMSGEPSDTQRDTPAASARVPAVVRRGAAPVARDTAKGAAARSVGAAPVAPATRAHGATATGAATTSDGDTESFRRESFAYDRGGRRDPFVSLMTTSELRPLISDLRLVAIAFDASGANSVAVLRDVNTKEQYRVKLGQVLGRMRVARIAPKDVTFTIEEFGFSRQESLSLGDPSQARKK